VITEDFCYLGSDTV